VRPSTLPVGGHLRPPEGLNWVVAMKAVQAPFNAVLATRNGSPSRKRLLVTSAAQTKSSPKELRAIPQLVYQTCAAGVPWW
jgi:hypothetical protein